MSFLDETVVNCGMYGYIPYNAGIHSTGKTYVDIGRPIQASGILSRVHMRLWSNGDAGSCKLGILRPAGGDDYTVQGVIDITTEVNIARVTSPVTGRFEFDTDTAPTTMGSIAVEAGDVLALYSDTGIYVGFNTASDKTTIYENGDQLTSGTVTINDGVNATHSFIADVYVTSNESIIFDDSTGYGDGESVFIPTLSDETYTIIIEDITVPDGEDLYIEMVVRDTTQAADYDGEKLYLDMTQAAGEEVIAALNYLDATLYSNTVTFESGVKDDSYSGFITINPTAPGLTSMKMSYANYQNGQGPVAGGANSRDILHASLGWGRWFTRRLNTNYAIKELKITNAGGNATVGRIIVSRKNVVAIGDSFAGTHTDADGTILNHVALELSDSGRFTEDRYVIRGGCNGNLLLKESSVFQSISHRVDNYISGLWALPNSVYVFINGPGINDIAGYPPTTEDEAIALGRALGWQVAGLSSKILDDGSEVILNEICYLEPGHVVQNEFTDLAVTTYNNTLAIVSAELQIPIAKTAAAIAAAVIAPTVKVFTLTPSIGAAGISINSQ